ncbi:MAG: PepSY-like domain-containing protein [Flavobacteriaceae bacterium]
MKYIILVALVVISASSTLHAQKNIPSQVVWNFEQKFPKAENIHWDKENSSEYEAQFFWNGEQHSANFNTKGEWLETEAVILFRELPDLVQQSVLQSHKKEKIRLVARIEKAKGDTYYEIEIKQFFFSREVFYDSEGNEIKS